MSSTDTAPLATLLIFSLVWLLVGVGFYVWYAWALSRLFSRLGTDGWRGWVPVLNEMTILERGGVPAWNVIFYFLPIVNLYGLYLKYTATVRIGERFGRGPGFAILGALLTPLWATMLIFQRNPGPGVPQHQQPTTMEHRQMAGTMGAPAAARAPQPGQPGPGMPPGPYADLPAPPIPGAPQSGPLQSSPSQPAGAAPPPSPQRQPVSPATPPIPAPANPVEPEPPTPPATAPADLSPPAPQAPMPEPAPPESPPSSPIADSGPILVHNPWARPSTTPSAADAPAAPSSPASSEAPAWLDAPAHAVADTAEPAHLADGDDDDGATVVVDRRPKVQWHLNVDGNAPLPLVGDKVLLGRRPSATAPGIHPLAVPDTTRTLSKAHAHLELTDGEWTITDLNSTNGVLIVDEAGEETLIAPGEPVPVTGRFILGKVGMSVSFEKADT